MYTLPEKLLFVDIDGCLTSVESKTYFGSDVVKYGPCEQIIEKVKRFCNEQNAKVIISSNWRKFERDGVWKNRYGTFKNPIADVERLFGDTCIGTLPNIRHIRKSEALILWFEETGFHGKFVIFDDDLREAYQTTHDHYINRSFILVDPQHGITDADLIEAKDILNRKDTERTTT